MAIFCSNASMSSSIALTPDQLALVRKILHEYVPGADMRVFGSRATGTQKPMSDLDLCIMGEKSLDALTRSHLEDAFSESILPMKVDIVEWARVSEAFRHIIDGSSVPLPS